MYISVEARDALCEAGIWAICLMFGTMALAVGLPWLWQRTRFMREVLEIKIAYGIGMAVLKHRRGVAVRRYRAAMRVFDKPVRWEEK